jgi:membrane associated rhomboid family serine protease
MVLGVIPARLTGLIQITPAVPAWLTPLTATLAHANTIHLGFNVLMLLWCGSKVERILGAGPLAFLYVIGAYTAAMAQWAVDPLSPMPMIGASGAISAVIGAFALSFGQQKRIVSSPALNRTLNALWLLAAWVVLQLMTGLLGGLQGFMLATPAHIGGFVAGLLLQRPLLLWRYRNA